MANWRKVIVSGSDAQLNQLNVDTSVTVTGSLTASSSVLFPALTNSLEPNIVGVDITTGQLYYQGTGSLTVTSASYAISASIADSSLTASYVNTLNQAVIISGSLAVNTPTGNAFDINADTFIFTGSLSTTGSVQLASDVAITGKLNVGSDVTSSGYQLYVTTSISDGSVGIDSSANINAIYLLKGGNKKFEISNDQSGANPIFRLLPYTTGGFIQIGNPSNAGNSNTDYVFISEANYGNVLLGPGLGNGTAGLPGSVAATHKVQIKGPLYISGSTLANGNINISTGGITVSGSSNFHDTLTVQGDLIVNGTASFINTQELLVKDKFTLFNSGSTSLTDTGFVFQYTSSAGNASGSAFYLDSANGTYGRFAVQYGVPYDIASITADEWVVTAKLSTSDPSTAPVWGGSGGGYGNIWVNTNTDDVFIWA
jgi:hypothetical protein